ncbi:hypothetical protein NJF44_00040 [Pseudomonas guariconensis]|uniref:dermonecrotic toxin domain-containing protein n=1 Tax=Pseudomonas TaxID=286 RepID=UPI001CE478C3|nr:MULTISPECIES: DUF6543 domain-containing protein [Pseudomonas]MCO7635995.1 hypothetical protein [Pseudomonas sp. S 311-6]MCO7513268.1 hypothetical protein [Pseudomonas putida]MCO7563339.1 hypothetical protein [Pseudomonas mosselii]MCO7603632.1 hypothetical protein [Pseudomonas guariconensis]MCO7615018.1 hypothetical protein [Pseudomonas guariconensis]
MTHPSTPIFDFKAAAARQFASRPTLRQVVSRQVLDLLLEQLPWLAYVEPKLVDADPLMLDSPDPDTEYWTTEPLVDVVLQAMLEGKPLDLEPIGARSHNLGLADTHRFPGSHSAFDTRRLVGTSEAFNERLLQLTEHFCQAQVDYWRGQGASGKSRDQWLQLLLKMALLRNLPLQGLDEQQQAVIRGLVKGGAQQPPVFAVQARLTVGEQHFNEMQPGLLVIAEWDERQAVLWCSPSSQVRAFDTLDDFALALRDELALRYHFDALRWDRQALEGNVFAQQCTLLLARMLDNIGRVRYQGLTVAQMERLFADLSDPAQWFVEGYYIEESTTVMPPPGIYWASANDSFAYQEALLDLALDHADADGLAALDGVLDLQSYTRQRLRERMLADYPVEANYFPDDLILELEIARGMPGGAATGSGGGEPLEPAGEKTLTEFAIGNLSSLAGAVIKGIRHRDDQLIMPWMNADYLKSLVQAVDIGGNYPRYVADALNDPQTRSERTRRFAREWRQSLVFSALQAKLDRKITELGLQCIVDFCRGHVDSVLPNIALIPLAFKRQPYSAKHDLVRGMYVLFSAEPAVVLLYRPLYGHDPLRQFASIEAMMAGIRESESLQASMVNWMEPHVRHIYDHGGFTEPHVTSIGMDPYDLPEKPEPAALGARLWLTDVDEKLYTANYELLLELANRQATSTAQSRWAILSQGAWLLFDLATLLLRGPVASAAWLVQAISSLERDTGAFEQGSEFDRSAATVDLIVNLGMALLHARLPSEAPASSQPLPGAAAFDGPPAQDGGYQAMRVRPTQGKVGMAGPLAFALAPSEAGLQLDFSWRGNRGFNWLAPEQRKALMAMRSKVGLDGLQSSADGLYQLGEQRYVTMLGETFAVSVLEEGVRVVDATGNLGPWLSFELGAWRIDARLRLSGGAPGGRVKEHFGKLYASSNDLTLKANAATDVFTRLGKEIVQLQGKVDGLEKLRQAETARRNAAGEDNASFDWAASDRMMASYDTRSAEFAAELRSKRLRAVEHLESAVRFDREQRGILESMLEAKYRSYLKDGLEESIGEKKVEVMTSLIRNSDFILSELKSLADYPRINEMMKRHEGRLITEVREDYLELRSYLQALTGFQERMLVAMGGLDELLTEAPRDLEISVADTHRTVADLIDERKYSTVDLRFQQVLVLAELTVHLELATGGRRVTRVREGLAGTRLQSAANAHGESLMANLDVADRISILQEAWDEYAAAIIRTLHIERTGGALVDVAMLERYREHMQLLKDDAGRRLVAAIAEQDGTPLPPPKYSPYRISSKPQRVLHNNAGQIVIATEVQEDERTVYEVRAPFSGDILQVFDLKDGAWVERPGESPEASPLGEGGGDEQVQALLNDNQDVISIARAYVDEGANGATLDALLQRQVERLQRTAAELAEQGASAGVTARLHTAVQDLESLRISLLTELYTRTKYPTADALRFLHDQRLIKVDYVRRDTSAMTSPFDEFKITRLNAPGVDKGRVIWAAHFHLLSQDASLEDFTHGHLKLWSHRHLGRRYETVSGERVHRGRLTRADVAGIIPLT